MLSPFLALESTVIAHGLPYPENLDTARELEALARAHGAEPRTIAVLDGQVKIGLNDSEIEHLAQTSGILKLSRRDIAIAVARKQDGATTVSATMFLAHRAGIRVFATGGIGGVHRQTNRHPAGDKRQNNDLKSPKPGGATQAAQAPSCLATDVSADLIELASTPVAVVCAGAKAILDLPATLEFLETHRVPVLGFHTHEFPAFYSRGSGLSVQTSVESATEAAAIIRSNWDLGNATGVLVAVPIPPGDEIPREQMEPFINQALSAAEEQGITGSAITPFVLRRLAELTNGASDRANRALLRNNVRVAAELAKELANLDVPVA